MTNVVITLEIATEALAEQSDSTGVTLIENTLGGPREGNNDLTKCRVICFFILKGEDNNIDNFVLNEYKSINRSSLFRNENLQLSSSFTLSSKSSLAILSSSNTSLKRIT